MGEFGLGLCLWDMLNMNVVFGILYVWCFCFDVCLCEVEVDCVLLLLIFIGFFLVWVLMIIFGVLIGFCFCWLYLCYEGCVVGFLVDVFEYGFFDFECLVYYFCMVYFL